MPTTVELSDDGDYVLVTQQGPVEIAQIKAARSDSLPLYFGSCDRALVDFQLADIGHLRLIDLDDLGISFKRDVPKCKRIAIVIPPKTDESRYAHLANAHTICGVETALFGDMEEARAWLLE
ncbi:MAG: hypothetical protein V7739_17160 [Motiliproteus sp.]